MSALPVPQVPRPQQFGASLNRPSWWWIEYVGRNSRVKGMARSLLKTLAENANPFGVTWRSIEDIADRMGLSPRQVRRYLSILIQSRELCALRSGGRSSSGRGITSTYLICTLPKTLDLRIAKPKSKADIMCPGKGGHHVSGEYSLTKYSVRFGSDESFSRKSSPPSMECPENSSLELLPNRVEEPKEELKAGSGTSQGMNGASATPRLRVSPAPDTRETQACSSSGAGKAIPVIIEFKPAAIWARLAKVKVALGMNLDEKGAMAQSRAIDANLRLIADRWDRDEILLGWIAHAKRLVHTVGVERLGAVWQTEVNKSLKALGLYRKGKS
jgi:hypothetical protein